MLTPAKDSETRGGGGGCDRRGRDLHARDAEMEAGGVRVGDGLLQRHRRCMTVM